MKTTAEREAKNGFGLMIDTARAKPVLIEEDGRGVVVVVSVQVCERLSVQSGRADQGETGTKGGHCKVANEGFARVKIDQLLKSTDWSFSNGRSISFDSPCGGEAGGAPDSCRGDPFAAPTTRQTSVSARARGTRKVCCADA
ncbi:hypothetical protein [Rhizobium leguminosarum]|uniref:hypothetical protein n=1 Tax=Rhizobium TaxID=379 RepID=UPI001C960CC2|nr:hypothetical protein [Rhizobium leguminosarum]